MKGWKALKALEEGKKLKGFLNGHYITLIGGMLIERDEDHKIVAINHIPYQDLFYDNKGWEIYEETEGPEEDIKGCPLCGAPIKFGKGMLLNNFVLVHIFDDTNNNCILNYLNGDIGVSKKELIKKWNTRK